MCYNELFMLRAQFELCHQDLRHIESLPHRMYRYKMREKGTMNNKIAKPVWAVISESEELRNFSDFQLTPEFIVLHVSIGRHILLAFDPK